MRIIEKVVIAKTSSTLAPASISVGIPLSQTKPFSCNLTIAGTTTAGETAARIKPKSPASIGEIGSKYGPIKVIVKPSNMQGIKLINRAFNPAFFNSFLSNPNPARSKITIRAISRKSLLKERKVVLTRLVCRRIIPANIIPINPGKPSNVARCLAANPNKSTRAKSFNIYISPCNN